MIYKNVYTDYKLSEESIENYLELVRKNPIVINPSEMKKINQVLGYISFSFKEIHEFLQMRNPEDENLIYFLRKPFQDYKFLKSEEDSFNNIKLSVYT